jgi:serine/threonine-protein kinase
MLTGRRAFDGEDTTDVLGAVVRLEPDWNAIPSAVPPLVSTLLRRCLVKDRRQRVADVSAALFVLDAGPRFAAADTRSETAWITRRAARRRIAAWSVAAIVIGAAAAAGLTSIATRPNAPRVTRLTIVPPSTATLALGGNTRDIAIAPDGSRVVYLGNNGRQLFMRALDQLDPVPLTPLGSPAGPFFSPDGLWVGYFEGPSTIMKVAITGGPPLLICRLDGAARGATWGPAGTIIFATNTASSGLQHVSEAGGPPSTLTKPNTQRGEVDHLWPEMLPSGRAVLFSIIPTTGPDSALVAVLDLQSGNQKILVRGGADAHYVPSGHLIYSAAGTLRGVPFDLGRLEAGVTPVPVVSEVVRTSVGAAEFDVARDGTLAYVSGAGQFEARTFVWVDREGKEEPLGTPLHAYAYPRLSPDRSKLAVAALDQERDIWIWDLKRQGLSRFTLDANEDRYPLWTPDGQRLMWDSTRNGPYNLFWQPADGTGTVERLTESPNTQAPHSFSPDGKHVVLREDVPGQGQDLVLLTLDGKRGTTPLLHAPYNERNGEISPNGKWLAYESDESGRFEIYVRPFPNVESGKSTISRGGGQQAAWSADGRQLFYRGPDGSVIGVTVDASSGFDAGPPQTIVREGYFTGGGGVFGRTYDVSGDGKRFLMIKQGGANGAASAPSITIVQNWLDELKRVVSVR